MANGAGAPVTTHENDEIRNPNGSTADYADLRRLILFDGVQTALRERAGVWGALLGIQATREELAYPIDFSPVTDCEQVHRVSL